NVSHQGQTRLYFDLIRNGAELNFLRLLPAPARQAILDDWYQQGGQLKLKLAYTRVDTATATGLTIAAAKPREDFAHQLLARYAAVNARPDPINRCEAGHCHRAGLTAELAAAEQSLSRLSGRPGAGMAVIGQLPEATLIRVQLADGRREIYSLLRNRAHSNVAFMFGEELRYQPQLDTLTVYPGILSSYPNFMFAVRAGEVSAFVQAMERVRSAAEFDQVVERWGVRRSHPEFWTYFHDLSAYLQETEPREAGVLDMNRYENL
ncbi:fatty acid cis/trans isomerase, partial [Stutzerimonas balearica]